MCMPCVSCHVCVVCCAMCAKLEGRAGQCTHLHLKFLLKLTNHMGRTAHIGDTEFSLCNSMLCHCIMSVVMLCHTQAMACVAASMENMLSHMSR
jgi:hypothetical protein